MGIRSGIGKEGLGLDKMGDIGMEIWSGTVEEALALM